MSLFPSSPHSPPIPMHLSANPESFDQLALLNFISDFEIVSSSGFLPFPSRSPAAAGRSAPEAHIGAIN
jgi:hypothetical protein